MSGRAGRWRFSDFIASMPPYPSYERRIGGEGQRLVLIVIEECASLPQARAEYGHGRLAVDHRICWFLRSHVCFGSILGSESLSRAGPFFPWSGSLRKVGQGSRQSSLMALAASNARVEPKGHAIIEQASGSAKIDPLMATSKAIALMSTNPWSNQPGIFVI